MRALDYILKGMENHISYDELGNVYIYTENLPWSESEKLDNIGVDTTNGDIAFISKEDCDKYNQYEIIIPDDINYNEHIRKPYYRMRGKPVTREQAFDIIRRTDSFFYNIDGTDRPKGYIDSCNFYNSLINRNHYPFGYGWIHVDGTVGVNSITGKYPNLQEYIGEWIIKLLAFPYLDLVIAVTDWNEVSEDVWKALLTDDYKSKNYKFETEDEKFCKAVVLGIYVHDKTLEILSPVNAVKKYKEYASLYGMNKDIFIPEYYQDNNITQVDLPYLKKCIEAYGLDADKVLEKIPEYEWKDK